MSVWSIVLSCNQLAMQHLHDNNSSLALQLLERAQEVLDYPDTKESQHGLLAITLNNLACYHKQMKDFSLSLHYLSQALELKVDHLNLAGTNLNLCAIHSAMNQHELALNHALNAVKILEKSKKKENLVIAYHNAGIEYEFLKKYPEARVYYEKALKLAYQELGENNAISQAIAKNFNLLKHRKILPSIRPKRNIIRSTGNSVIDVKTCLPKKGPRKIQSQGERRPVPPPGNKPIVRHNFKGRKIFDRKTEALQSIQSKINGLQEQLNLFEKQYKEILPFVLDD